MISLFTITSMIYKISLLANESTSPVTLNFPLKFDEANTSDGVPSCVISPRESLKTLLESLKTSLIDFISISKKYHTIKFLITCRSEFYEKKYNYITSDELSDITYRVTDLKEEYTEEQLNHIIDS